MAHDKCPPGISASPNIVDASGHSGVDHPPSADEIGLGTHGADMRCSRGSRGSLVASSNGLCGPYALPLNHLIAATDKVGQNDDHDLPHIGQNDDHDLPLPGIESDDEEAPPLKLPDLRSPSSSCGPSAGVLQEPRAPLLKPHAQEIGNLRSENGEVHRESRRGLSPSHYSIQASIRLRSTIAFRSPTLLFM